MDLEKYLDQKVRVKFSGGCVRARARRARSPARCAEGRAALAFVYTPTLPSDRREFVGVLKGFDQLVNLVLDDAIEYVRDPADAATVTETTRYVGLVVARGPVVTIVGPEDGFKAIDNPFVGGDEDEAAA